jgi:uncharacterized protein YgbK (DUF1537 family)
MYKKADQVLSQLPPQHHNELLTVIRKEFLKSERTIVVFDDDPTGTQTCHDVVVLTTWSVALIAEELKKKPAILFILTNSRSLSESGAIELTAEVGRNVKDAINLTGRQIVAISRSDSTLRGHFPAEVRALSTALSMDDAVWVLIPAFIEGGRLTIDDIHYIVEGGELIPVADTPFAQDKSFGYRHSNVREWIEEKTHGLVKASEVVSLSLEQIRRDGSQYVSTRLSECKPGDMVLVNAVSYKDLEVVAIGLQAAETSGQKFLFRSSASFVPIRAGILPGSLFTPHKSDLQSRNGSLIIVGSYVPKTTSQLNHLLKNHEHIALEMVVSEILSEKGLHASTFSQQIDRLLADGRDVVLYTSRGLQPGSDAEGSLRINNAVSNFLVKVVRHLSVRPSFIIAKGGITSSDLASKALLSEKALILGQAIPGVPVWKLDVKAKFSKILYIVFPGNVGGESALSDVWYRFKYKV